MKLKTVIVLLILSDWWTQMCELSQNYMFKTLLTCRQIRVIIKWKPCSASNPVYSNRVRLTARNCSSFSFCKFCNTARNKQQKIKSFCAYLGISTELILHLGAWCTVSQLCRTTVWRRRVAVVFFLRILGDFLVHPPDVRRDACVETGVVCLSAATAPADSTIQQPATVLETD